VSFSLRFLFPVCLALFASGQQPAPNKTALTNLTEVAPGVIIELRYKGTDHFFKKAFYPAEAKALLLPHVAAKIAAVQKELAAEGLGLKIWDAYRPLSVQKAMWAAMPDPKYVADPAKGGRHNRGAAVDVTLVDAKGQELEMPTAHDDFTEKAGAYFKLANPTAFKNRQRLQEMMRKHGFLVFESEWWHFDDAEWQKCPVIQE
jgi:zinc D-Ala-D-Ala dipeptidase